MFNNSPRKVYSQNEPIKKGDPIIITKIDGFNLVVEKQDLHNNN
ncbi:NfeD family protein [Clostridium botulinum]|nr:NfeD family protein [Clostridium botulinum]MCS4524013.1 NfeD family protein [Clostridium botulinum]MCS4525584.1 NfeD family protein [Clostridium botulinum]